MHFVGVHFGAQRGVHALVALNGAFALEVGRNDGGIPVAAITFQRDVFTGKARSDDVFELVCSHVSF
ncbi:hypothetical protein D3C87_2018300 [compost metagenome]